VYIPRSSHFVFVPRILYAWQGERNLYLAREAEPEHNQSNTVARQHSAQAKAGNISEQRHPFAQAIHLCPQQDCCKTARAVTESFDRGTATSSQPRFWEKEGNVATSTDDLQQMLSHGAFVLYLGT
jgi:hypothetical protein